MAQIVYARVNQILEDELTLLGTDAARTPITGKIQSDFTITLSRGTTTGLSTSGITITEIGSGKYDVSMTAATVASTGVYTLRVSITVSGNAYVWEAIYVVTSDGTPSGTSGSASFTATAGNGRITDGTSALVGATIYIRDPSGNLYTTTSSRTGGVWGPVYFSVNGVYTVFSQLSAYTQGAATITVSGATATLTPATDISMPAISTGSGLTASELVAYARRMARDRTGTKADVELLQSVNMALDMVCKARIWPRYVTRGQLSLNGQYATGTVAMTVGSASITLSGGTWPTWAASGSIQIGGQIFKVSSRTSSTVIAIEATWVDSTLLSSSYVLFQDTYALPMNMYRFGKLVPGQRWPYGGDPVGPEVLIEQQMLVPYSARGPTIWCFANDSIVVYPYPSQDILCGYWYYRRPTPLVNSTDTADFDGAHIELLRRAIDYQVAVLYGDYSGGKPEDAMARFNETMGRSASNDKSTITTASPMVPPLMGSELPLWLRRPST